MGKHDNDQRAQARGNSLPVAISSASMRAPLLLFSLRSSFPLHAAFLLSLSGCAEPVANILQLGMIEIAAKSERAVKSQREVHHELHFR